MPTDAQVPAVSCVICMHREGLLAHTTLHSLERARKYAESEGVAVQFVIALDNADASTIHIATSHPVIREQDIVDLVVYGDSGASRNHGIRRSSGTYIIIVDGDDYCSDNFILFFVHQVAQDKGSIAFPEYIFTFGLYHSYLRMGQAVSAVERSYALFNDNIYCYRLGAHRDVFLRIPFAECSKGFGYEDWHWACEASAAGLKFVPAPGVVLFYRRRVGSRVEGHAQENTLIPRSKFFEMLPPPAEPLPEAPPASAMPATLLSKKALAREVIIACLRVLPASVAEYLYAKLKKIFGGAPPPPYPLAIQKALAEVAVVDGMLHPNTLPQARLYTPHYDVLPGKVYASIWHEFQGRSFDIVYMVPHLGVGGADRMATNYMTVMRRLGKRVLCLLVCDVQRDLGPVPEGVTVVRFGQFARCLSLEQQRFVLARLLLQLEPTVIHAVTDWLSYEVLQTYGEALKHKSRLCASIFADAQDTQDTHYGAGSLYLRGLTGCCAKIITDNMVTAREWHGRLGVPLEMFQPVYGVAEAPRPLVDAGTRGKRMLWAGRLDKEKRLDILLAIAQALPEVFFDVYGQAVLDKDNTVEALEQLPNVTLCGGYRDFYELPLQQYAALVYTTQNEGLPNVLLEAAACGLPLIAPDRGGIADFVSEDTGWLIALYTDVTAYVNAIQAVLADTAEAVKRAQRAQDLLRCRHTQEAFSTSLLQAYGLSSCEEE